MNKNSRNFEEQKDRPTITFPRKKNPMKQGSTIQLQLLQHPKTTKQNKTPKARLYILPTTSHNDLPTHLPPLKQPPAYPGTQPPIYPPPPTTRRTTPRPTHPPPTHPSSHTPSFGGMRNPHGCLQATALLLTAHAMPSIAPHTLTSPPHNRKRLRTSLGKPRHHRRHRPPPHRHRSRRFHR